MVSRFIHSATCNITVRIVVVLLGSVLLASCSYGPTKIRAHITNVRAKPNSHLIAVAVQYEKYRDATGINTFPNGGIPKMLDQKAKIYLCDAETLEVRRLAAITPAGTTEFGWQPWILGWLGDTLYFQLSGQGRTTPKDFEELNRVVYKIDLDGKVSEVQSPPGEFVYQNNTGPVPKGSYVRISKGYDTIDMRTDKNTNLRTLFRTDAETGELIAITKIEQVLLPDADKLRR